MWFNRKKKYSYPVEMKKFKYDLDKVPEIFVELKPHKGTFISVTMLHGSFLCENAGEVFKTLELGEKLLISADPNSKLLLPPILVHRQDKTFLGKIPATFSLLPFILLQREIDVWCHIEAMTFEDEYLEIAVSIYCENY